MSPRARRILLVTLGLSAGGAVFGSLAVIAAVGLLETISFFVRGPSSHDTLPLIFLVGLFVGGPLGAVLAPIAGWFVLRYAPLGLAFLGLTIGATLGGLGGVAAQRQVTFTAFPFPILTAVFGFAVAAVLLRLKYGPKS